MKSKQALLDQIAADIVAHNVCPDLAESAIQLVIGDGNPDADLLFIGEAPGKREDEQGIPFVGASGKFLAGMLESIHLTRSQVYITNIVKYRPPQNRDPLPAEKKEFLPYLMRQIEVIQPKLIITLGRHSGMQFLPELVMSRDHGQPKKVSLVVDKSRVASHESRVEQQSVPLETRDSKLETVAKYVVLPLYHPATARFNGIQMRALQSDFALIPTILEKIRNDN